MIRAAALWFLLALPAQAIDLSRWKLTLPIDPDGRGRAGEIADPARASRPPWFHATEDGLIFRANAGGARTSGNTAYARSELREMAADGHQAAWDCIAATRSMTLEQDLLATTTAKPEVTIGQIHDARNDNLMLKYIGPADADGHGDTGRIELLLNNATQRETLDPAYTLGQSMRVRIAVEQGRVRVDYHNLASGKERRVDTQFKPESIRGSCFFKAGMYIQACSKLDVQGRPNIVCEQKAWPESRYDAPDAWAEVLIRRLELDTPEHADTP